MYRQNALLTALEHFPRNFATVALLVKRFSKVVDVVEARVQLDLGRICAWIAWKRLIVDCGKAPVPSRHTHTTADR